MIAFALFLCPLFIRTVGMCVRVRVVKWSWPDCLCVGCDSSIVISAHIRPQDWSCGARRLTNACSNCAVCDELKVEKVRMENNLGVDVSLELNGDPDPACLIVGAYLSTSESA